MKLKSEWQAIIDALQADHEIVQSPQAKRVIQEAIDYYTNQRNGAPETTAIYNRVLKMWQLYAKVKGLGDVDEIHLSGGKLSAEPAGLLVAWVELDGDVWQDAENNIVALMP